jgi:hypothetical protein
VPKKNNRKDVDAEVDFHGHTAEQMRLALEKRWPGWKGMARVRIVHGQGEVLAHELAGWCRARGIVFEREVKNPGATVLYPTRRTPLEGQRLSQTLAEKGLRLTPEQEALLRDPEAVKRAQEAARRRQEADARQRREEAAQQAAQRRLDERLWQAEMARLDSLDARRGGKKAGVGQDDRPPAPYFRTPVAPPTKEHEGYWRAEIVRVAETDTDTLKKQKRAGLDKLAPPLELKPKPPQPPAIPAPPERDWEADHALFEAEMERLAQQE